LPKDKCEALVRSITLDPLTPHTITDRWRLQIELGIATARGYAIDDEEIVLGVRCVAAPIVDSVGQVRGASHSRRANGELVRIADTFAWNDPAVKALCTAPDGASWAACHRVDCI
jgi:Bacterial transcriptional regulator